MRSPALLVVFLLLATLSPGVAHPQPPMPAADTSRFLPLVLSGRYGTANDSVATYTAPFQYGLNSRVLRVGLERFGYPSVVLRCGVSLGP
jgi:hypothetical protein